MGVFSRFSQIFKVQGARPYTIALPDSKFQKMLAHGAGGGAVKA